MSMLKNFLEWFTIQENYFIVTAIGTLIVAMFAVLAWVRGWTLARRVWHWLKRPRLRIPRATLHIFPIRRYPLMSDQRWHTVLVGDQPAMHIITRLLCFAISDANVILLGPTPSFG